MPTTEGSASEAADVRAAGTFIVENWQRFTEITYKSAIDIVTEIDRKAEEKIV